jgi:hypothetical protein
MQVRNTDVDKAEADQENHVLRNAELDPATKTALMWRYTPTSSPEICKGSRKGSKEQSKSSTHSSNTEGTQKPQQVCYSYALSCILAALLTSNEPSLPFRH